MPKISDMRESRFLKQSDVGKGLLVTITGCVHMNVSAEGADPESKWCMTFREHDKPLVINMTNAQMCAAILGSENTDDWVGKHIVLYVDPSVMYGGKMVGGIRVRAPKPGAVLPKPVVLATEMDESDVPF